MTWVLVILVVVLLDAGYTAIHPNTTCPGCVKGRVYASNGRDWHPHARCNGKGDLRRFRWWAPFASRKIT